jgi:predicted DsbA family dithiol-disulfide isomerase
MRPRRMHTTPILWALTLVLAFGWAALAQTPVKSEPLAEVGGQVITAEEVEKALGVPLRKLEEQIYTMKRQKVEALIAERLLAKEAARRGITVQALLDAEVTAKLEQLLSRYGDKVKLVHRDFPIDSLHPQARKGHEAARCAHDQGKFWAYHDLLYANAPKASPEQLKVYAQQVGLDLTAFEQCLSSGTY